MPLRQSQEPSHQSHARSDVRSVPSGLNPCALHGALSEGGTRPGAILLESGEPGVDAGRRSIVVPDPLLSIRIRGDEVEICALVPRGRPLLTELARRTRFAGESAGITPDRIVRVLVPERFDPGLDDACRLTRSEVLDELRELVGLVKDAAREPGLPIAIYGQFSFDCIDRFDDLPERPTTAIAEDDLQFVLGLDGIVFDHATATVEIVTRALHGPDCDAAQEHDAAGERHRRYEAAMRAAAIEGEIEVVPVVERDLPDGAVIEPTDAAFEAGVERVKEAIAAGEVFQTVLSREIRVAHEAAPLDVYARLRALDPSPWMFCFRRLDGTTLFGASPETSVQVVRGKVQLQPIAGTAPRAIDENGCIDVDRDGRLATGLLLDHKEQAEHAMLIDLARNDVARVSRPGTREVHAPFTIRRFARVQHLVSEVCGTLREPFDALDAYRACANMGTLTGAPKLRATELIREIEQAPRGAYGGALGYLTADGELATCIVIRSFVVRDGVYHLRVGAGIVQDSIPAKESAETLHKARAALTALAMTPEAVR